MVRRSIRIGEFHWRRRQQHFERCTEPLGEAEGSAGTGLSRAVLVDGEKDPDRLHVGTHSPVLAQAKF
jgi:hypothetical protein